jgi:type I restriction enzyme S subunit
MNPAQLLAHFDRVTEAPDAAPRLRRFILDLAVQGKLVVQDPTDEPASKLRSRIAADVKRRTASGDFNEPRNAIGLPRESLPFVVPSSWEWARLIELADVSYGFAFESALFNQSKRGVPLIRIRDISGTDTEAHYDGPFEEFYRVQAGDYLVGMDGDFNVRRWRGPAALLNQRVMRVRGWRAGLLPEFLTIPLQMILDHLHRTTSLTTVKHLSAKQVNGISLPLPPLAEQHRIVAKVDELTALCDRLEAAQTERETRRDRVVSASLSRLSEPAADDAEPFRDQARFHLRHLSRLTTRREHIQQLRQTILNLAVRGRLVAQQAHDEPAAQLHDRLRVALARGLGDSRTRRELLPAASRFFEEGTFPGSWVLTNFDSVNAIASGVAKGKDLRGLKTANHPYLRVANVQRGHLDLRVVKELAIRVDEIGRYRLHKGDVLMTEGGDWDKLGRAAIWNDEIPDCIHQNHIYRIRPANGDDLQSEWVMLFANSSLGRSYFEGASKQTTNLASINMTQLRSCPLPLPPRAEQRRIVAKVDELMAMCDQLEARLTSAQGESRRLLEAVFHQALSLVA